MKNVENNYKQIQYESTYLDLEESPCNGVENVSILVHKKKVKNRKKHNTLKYGQPAVPFRLSRYGPNKRRKFLTKPSSMPEINKRIKLVKQRTRSSDAILKKKNQYFNSKYIVNRISEYYFNEYLSPFNCPSQKKWKVYRCQIASAEDSCCCSCNSDAMFEVMKSLYDCYKKKNCDNCNCILCAHLPLEERRIGEIKKSLASVGLTGSAKERKDRIKKAEKSMEGKSIEEKEKILKELIKSRQPIPPGKTASEKALIQRVRTELGLPPEPKTAEEKAKMRKAEAAGVITPLEGKTTAQKEQILRAQTKLGIPLPEGRTASEKALIAKIKAEAGIPDGIPSEKLRKAKAAGLLTPLAGKSPEQREKILRGLAMHGLPLPEGQTASERQIIDKVRADMGLPPEPKTDSMKRRYAKAAKAGLMQPLEGKSAKEKEKILKGLADAGIPLPEGRTASEKALIAKVKAKAGALEMVAPSEKIRRAKAAGFLTPLEGKAPEEKEKILKGLAMQGLPLPEAKTNSEKKISEKVRHDLGLPPEPKTPAMREKYNQAAKAGILQPLEGKTYAEKEKILQGLHDMGIPLPEGRTPSEKSLIARVKAGVRAPVLIAPSEKLRKAKAAGLITPLEGKSHEDKEKILKGLAMHGILLPEGKTASEKKLIDKVRHDVGLPPEPKTADMKQKYAKAADAGLMEPLEGKSNKEKEKILKGLLDMGIPLPEGRTESEKSLIAKVKAGIAIPSEIAESEKIRRAKAAGLITPLAGKSPQEKEKILRGLAMRGVPLPEGKTASEKKLIEKIRRDVGLPPEPKTPSMKERHARAQEAGLMVPLEGKSAREREKILRGLHDMGIALPEGRTKSEKALIAKVQASPPVLRAPSEKLRKAKAAGLITPLEGKSHEDKEKILKGLAMHGILLPEGKTASERKLMDKIRHDVGLPPEPKTAEMRQKYAKAADAGLMEPLEGKTNKEKEKVLKGLLDMGIPLPEGRTESEKSLIAKVKAGIAIPSEIAESEKLRRAKAAGLITPLAGKSPQEKEKILRGLAMRGVPLPEGKTASEKKLIEKIRRDVGLPPEPKTPSMKERHARAQEAGLMVPLEGKSAREREKILRGLHDMGIALPEGRTKSEKALIAKVQASPPVLRAPSEKLRKAKAAGLITPLEGKSHEDKEKILKGLAMHGILLPEGKTASERKLMDKIRHDVGLPPEPKTAEMRQKYAKAADAGLMEPLEGKTNKEKEKVLKGLLDMGIPLPEGRTESEKSLIAKVKAGIAIPSEIAESEKLRRAKAAGLITPLAGKSPQEKEKILRGLAMRGVPLPEGKTASEKKLIEKIRRDVGLPPEPKTPSMKERHARAQEAGLMVPLEGKSAREREKILRGLHDMGIALPEGRTKSEKALIAKVQASPPVLRAPSEKLRKAKAAGLITPLEGKSHEDKEKILKGLAMHGILLPEGKTASERKLMDKIRHDVGLPPEPKTAEMRQKYAKAADAGLMEPLEGKTNKEKEKVLKGLLDMGIPLPEGRTESEKSLIAKVKAGIAIPSEIAESEKLRRAKAAGLITPLAGKSPQEKEKILRGLAMRGVPLPEGKTASEKKLIEKIRRDVGLPPEPKTPSMKERHARAQEAGLMVPLEGKSAREREKILRGLHDMGIALPEGRTKSEKALIAKVQASPPVLRAPSEKLRKAKAAGLITPLEGKSHEDKEKILKGLAMHGILLPEGKTASERKLMDKIRHDVGLPPEPKTAEMRQKYAKAADAGLMEPLEGKTNKEKEKVLKGLLDMGIPLPEGRTESEKSLIAKVKAGIAIPSEIAESEKLRRAKAAGLITPLAGKSPQEKEKILRGLAMRGVPLPEGKTASEKKLIEKIRRDVGLPPEPKTPSMKERHARAQEAGLMVPLEGKSAREREKILRGLHDMGIALPEGRTKSEKALIAKVQASPPVLRAPSEKLRKAKAAGLITPLEGKSHEDKEKILKGLAMHGILLPEGKTASERKLMDKIRHDVGLPPEPKTAEMRQKYAKAADAGLMEPLEGKTNKEKEKVLKGLLDMGIPLPEGRTESEKSLIAKVKAGIAIPSEIAESEKLRRAKAAGLITPLAGKSPQEKEKILRGLAMRGVPLPEGKTASEKKLIEKIRRDVGLPPEPKTPSMKERHARAQEAGLMVPLEGKSAREREKILRGLHDMGIALPEGRTKSEKALIAKVQASPPVLRAPSEKLRKAKAAGLITPLEGKSHEDKEKILKGLAMHGILLPEGKTASERKLMDKIRHDVGLPPEPKTAAMRQKYAKAADAGLMEPLEGKTNKEKEKVLKGLLDMGIPLPEGRTESEKSLIAKVKAGIAIPSEIAESEKLRRAKAAGLITPLAGKSPQEKEKILRGLAMRGVPLPEGKTASEKKLIEKIRRDVGLPPEPKTPSMKERHARAQEAGLMVPLEGKSAREREKILRGLHDMGIALPEGRTKSEKALIAKVQASPPVLRAPSEKLRKAKAAGLITPLEGKSHEDKEKILKGLAMHGILLPEGKTASERKLMDKIRHDVGLPPEPKTAEMRQKYAKAADAGLMEPLEGKTNKEKEKVLRGLLDMGIPLPEGRTESEKSLIAKVKAGIAIPSEIAESEKLRRAKAAGLLTPLEGKTPQEKEKILRGLAMRGVPLPEGKTASEKKLIEKIRRDVGLPPEPKTPSMKERHARAQEAGLMVPLEGKSAREREKILKGLHDMGIPLPEGRTKSEKALIAKVKAAPRAPSVVPSSERLRKAKAAGLLTPLAGKSPAQREKILRGLAMHGVPLPEGKTASEKMLIDKVRVDLGLPPEPKTAAMKDKYAKAADAGLLQPLEGKTPKEKEKILRGLHDMGIPLPEGRTASEKALIAKVKGMPREPSLHIPSEKLRKAQAAGLLTPLEGKTPAQQEKILRGLAMHGIPLPEGKTASEKRLIDKVRVDLGLPPAPKTAAEKDKYNKAIAAGLITPLEGKSPSEKERILRAQYDLGLPLPEARTSSEKSLIRQIKAGERRKTRAVAVGPPALPPDQRRKLDEKTAKVVKEGKGPADECICGLLTPESEREPTPSKKLKAAKAAGLLTPLEGKTPEQKEKIIRALVKQGLPLPEGKTASDRKIIEKVRADLGLPPEPKTASMKEKYATAQAAGIITPLEGKTAAQKENILRRQAEMGLELPEGRTSSEKALIAKIKGGTVPSITTEKLKKAKAAGLLTPLEGKTPEQKEKILRGLAKAGLPLPEGKTASEKILIKKIKAEAGIAEITPSEKVRRAKKAGLLTPLEGKTQAQKEKILRGRAAAGLPLPVGRTPSERALIQKIKTETGYVTPSPSEAMRRAKAAGLLTPLEGKTRSMKEKILRDRVAAGVPIPEGKTPSEKEIIKRITAGEPPAVLTPSEKLRQAKPVGVLTPLEGKTIAQKEKILKGLVKSGEPLPEGKTASEKELIKKVRTELGLPPEPTTASTKEKMRKAQAAGIITPLEGKTSAQKEKILKSLADAGIPLPEGRTASEKALIAKIKTEYEPTKIPSDKLRKAKAAGLLTPLEGKTEAQKEKIIRSLAEAGLPIPEGKTASEKALIHKVRTELGIPPSAKTPSEKSAVRKAKAEGLFTPLTGKSAKEKERILKGLAEAGLPMPEGKTASEKELIRKVRAAAGLPPEPTPSEKRGEIKTKSKKIGVSPSKKIARSAGIRAPGVTDEFEDIVKVGTCDRGCGCDKKKIRFKHSYVKIRVTSPDISSLCPCPDECLPGVKGGAFIDNEGIKVTVGIVAGVPSYTSQYSNDILETSKHIITLYDKMLSNSYSSSNTSIDTVDVSFDKPFVENDLQKTKLSACPINSSEANDDPHDSASYVSHTSYKIYNIESDHSLYEETEKTDTSTEESDRIIDTHVYLKSAEDIYRNPISISYTSEESTAKEHSSHGSFDSILVIKSESSLSLSTKSDTSGMDVISVISFSNSSAVSISTHYLFYPVSEDHFSDSTVEDLESFTNSLDYSGSDYSDDHTVISGSNNLDDDEHIIRTYPRNTENRESRERKQMEYMTFRMSQTKCNKHNNMKVISTRKTNNGEPILVINNLDSEHDITTMVDELLSHNEFSNASSIFLVVPTSDDNDSDNSSGSPSSTICIQLSKHYPTWQKNQLEEKQSELMAIEVPRRTSSTHGVKISAKGKKFFMEGIQGTPASCHNKETTFIYHHDSYDNPSRMFQQKETTKNKLCQIVTPKEMLNQRSHGVSTDTTADRPCCCAPKQIACKDHDYSSHHRCIANVVSELITPLLVNQGLHCDAYRAPKRSIRQQASFVSINHPTTPITACNIPPCVATECHHPSDMDQIPFGTPMPKPVPAPEPPDSKKLQPCQCSPEKIKELLEQAVKAGKTLNMKSIGCGGAADVSLVSPQPESPQPISPQPISPQPVSPKSVPPKPTRNEEDCTTCSQHKYKDGMKMKCACSGKKKTVKIRPLCPCEQHQPPLSLATTGPKPGTRSIGCQCCVCDDSNLGQPMRTPGQTELLGPMGGFVVIEIGGTYTQAGFNQPKTTTESSTSPRKSCVCTTNKKGKKKNNVICECPPPEPEPEPVSMPLPQDLYANYQWVDERLVLKMKSDMTQTHSGFKFFKKKKPPPEPEVEFTIEDAVRYYATMNPSLLRDLVPPPIEYREKDYKDCTCESHKKAKSNDVDCSCDYGGEGGSGFDEGGGGAGAQIPLVTVLSPCPPPCPAAEAVKEDDGPLRGFKFSMSGKGSGSKGLSGVCCFDMTQEISRTRLRHFSE